MNNRKIDDTFKSFRASLYLKFCSLTLLFGFIILQASFASPDCWIIDIKRTYNYTKDTVEEDMDEEPFRKYIERKRTEVNIVVRLLYPEGGDAKLIAAHVTGSTDYYRYLYTGYKNEICQPDMDKKTPGSWREDEESQMWRLLTRGDLQAGCALIKLGDSYSLDVSLSKLYWSINGYSKSNSYSACSENSTNYNKPINFEVDATPWEIFSVSGKGTEDSFSGGTTVQDTEKDGGIENATVYWNARKVQCDCDARITLFRGEVKVNGKPVGGQEDLKNIDLRGAVIETGKRSRVSLKLGRDISVFAASNSKLDLKDLCARPKEYSLPILEMIKGKIYATVSRFTYTSPVKIKVSSAVVGHRGEIKSGTEHFFASLSMPVVHALPEDDFEQAYIALKPGEAEINASAAAFFIGADQGYFFVKVDKGKLKVAIPGKPEVVLTAGKEISWRPESNELSEKEEHDIIVIPVN